MWWPVTESNRRRAFSGLLTDFAKLFRKQDQAPIVERVMRVLLSDGFFFFFSPLGCSRIVPALGPLMLILPGHSRSSKTSRCAPAMRVYPRNLGHCLAAIPRSAINSQ